MQSTQYVAAAFTLAFTLSGISVAVGQSYPNKPIHFITSAPGGANDLAIRIIANELRSSLGQPVIVENRGGTSATAVAAQAVSKAPPDGYTLIFYSNSLWTESLLQHAKPFDPAGDFTPVTLAVSSPNIVVVHPSLPVKSIGQLIALAKSRPNDLIYASGSVGSSNHLATEMFNASAGIKMIRVGYRGTPPGLTALMSGEAQVMFPVAAAVLPHMQSGRLRALAVTSLRPSALAPGLPTVAASGLPNYESEMMMAVFAPVGTPVTIVNRLNQEIAKALGETEVKERFFKSGVETIGSSPEQLASVVRSEVTRLGQVIKQVGISAN